MPIVPPNSVSDWDPGQGPPASDKRLNQLMATSASEDPDNVTKGNPKKAFVGKGGTPKGPFGLQGKEF